MEFFIVLPTRWCKVWNLFMIFFSTCKGKICVVFGHDLQHLGPGDNGYKGIQMEYFPKHFWVLKGLI